MRFDILGGVLALAGSAVAFSDSTPYVLVSTSTFGNVLESNKIHTSKTVQKFSEDVLATCPSDNYLLVTQPGVNAADIRRSDGCSMPHLCKALDDSRIQGKLWVPEVVGDLDREAMAASIKRACEGKNKVVTIKEANLAPVSRGKTRSVLAANDAVLADDLEAATHSDSYTIIFLSTAAEPVYEAEFSEPLRMDLKRHVQGLPIRRQDNETEWNKLPLFEKYQFFTPGVFMGLLVAIVLFSILYSGLSAMSTLEIPYGAFDKDMGPAAHKKQQ